MEEIIKNNELQNDQSITAALDNAMGVTSPDIVDETTYEADGTETDIGDNLIIEYASGITLTMSYDEMDWDGIWKTAVPDMLTNLSVLKHMHHDILSQTDDVARNTQAIEAIDLVQGFFKSVGVPEIDYDLRPDITIVEKALSVITDGIILLYELTHTAQIYVLTSKTDGMTIEKMIETLSDQMSNFHFGGNDNQ